MRNTETHKDDSTIVVGYTCNLVSFSEGKTIRTHLNVRSNLKVTNVWPVVGFLDGQILACRISSVPMTKVAEYVPKEGTEPQGLILKRNLSRAL